ncbi:DUF1566 domain-containing protein [Marinomonas ostreistagni]|uniref:DUF1566 domain-containing protein n=1 Tax=Marinomonas ostreistagni TaxID=359209 RepID=A0ABS0ZB87_9GAMM|nr:DUF1566 domain-containing protein [Marinomonas ostreistagni]MBJ7550915.1 DUF1566 domain-containing protein [Marinomonas ostreistagni]
MMNKKYFSVLCCMLSLNAWAGCNTSTITATTPASNFTVDAENGVVVDHSTGLMWKQCVEGFSGSDCRTGDTLQSTFSQVLSYIDSLNADGGFAGYTDWRLPNVKELRSIVEERCTRPALNEDVFPLKNTQASDDQSTVNSMVLFSSTPTSYYDSTDTFVWVISFADGTLDKSSVGQYDYVRFFRLVRDAR